MNNQKKALKAAFPLTIPVLTGFTVLGIAYGILMNTKGFGIGWTFIMSTFVFAGSMQYVAITLLTAAFNPLYVFLITLMVNARHMFYGISMINKFKETKCWKPYFIFGLCDETFSILCSSEPDKSINRNMFIFYITLLNHIYWIIGSVIGSLIGNMISFNTRGLEFVLTSLFIVIFLNQWKEQRNHKPALIGVFSSILCLLIFGKENFIIPSMICILLILTIFQSKLAKEVG